MVHPSAVANVFGLQRRFGKGILQISDDGACLVNGEIIMPQDRHTIEGMEREVTGFSHFRLQVMERVGHIFVSEDQPHGVDKGAARKAIDDWIGHGCSLPPFLTELICYRRQNNLDASRSTCSRVRPKS